MFLVYIMSKVIFLYIHRCRTGLANLRRINSRVLFHLLENHLPRLA